MNLMRQNAIGQFISKSAAPDAQPLSRLLLDEKGVARYYRHNARHKPAVKHFRVDEILKPADRPAYQKLLRDPRSTNKSLHAWLMARGCDSVGLAAVGAHRRYFLSNIDGFICSTQVAQSIAAAARDEGAATLTEAAQARYEQLFFNSLLDIKPDATLAPSDWRTLAQTLKDLAAARQRVEQIREGSANKPGGKARETAEDRLAAEEAATEAGPLLVARMRRILNLDGPISAQPQPPRMLEDRGTQGGG